jgi:hypothetical protein
MCGGAGSRDECPSKLAGGLSCTEAETEYHRELRARAPVPDEVRALRAENAELREKLAAAVLALTACRVRTGALVDEVFR